MKICNLSVVWAISAVFSFLCAGAYGEDEIKKLYLKGGGGQIADMEWYYLDGGQQVSSKWIQGSDASIQRQERAHRSCVKGRDGYARA